MLVSAGFFETLGVRPLLGRTVRAEDDLPRAEPVAVLSYALWQPRFGGRADVIGSTFTGATLPTEVIGIMPPRFQMPSERRIDLYLPVRIQPGSAELDGR